MPFSIWLETQALTGFPARSTWVENAPKAICTFWFDPCGGPASWRPEIRPIRAEPLLQLDCLAYGLAVGRGLGPGAQLESCDISAWPKVDFGVSCGASLGMLATSSKAPPKRRHHGWWWGKAGVISFRWS